MGKKKKKKKVKTTIFVSLEGKREELFFKVIENFANEAEKNINFNEDNESKISINFDEIKGGNSTYRLCRGISRAYNYDRVYVFFDEDIPLTNEVRTRLGDVWGCSIDKGVKDKDLQKKYNQKNKNPILIVSNPCCFDGFLLNLFNCKLPTVLKTDNCKQSFNNLIVSSSMSEKDFYESKGIEYYKLSEIDIMKLIINIFN